MTFMGELIEGGMDNKDSVPFQIKAVMAMVVGFITTTQSCSAYPYCH